MAAAVVKGVFGWLLRRYVENVVPVVGVAEPTHGQDVRVHVGRHALRVFHDAAL